jgi:hypothetical protein
MKVTQRRSIMVTSVFNEISTDQLENNVVVREDEEALPLQQKASGQRFKDDVNGFSSI